MTATRPPLPPFDVDTAAKKARLAEDAWNSRDPVRVSLAYTDDSRWRNRDEFFHGRDAIVAFLTRKWQRELDYRLIKEVWAFHGDRIAVRFQNHMVFRMTKIAKVLSSVPWWLIGCTRSPPDVSSRDAAAVVDAAAGGSKGIDAATGGSKGTDSSAMKGCHLEGGACVADPGTTCCPQTGVRFDVARSCWQSRTELAFCVPSSDEPASACGVAPAESCYVRIGDAGEVEAWYSESVWNTLPQGFSPCDGTHPDLAAAPRCSDAGR